MTSVTPPAGVVTWRTHLTLLLLALVFVLSYVDRQVIAIMIEPIKAEFQVSDTAMGLLTGLVFGVIYAILSIPLGNLADRGANRRNMVAVCCGLWSLATATCGVATQFWHLLFGRMAVAVGEAGGMAPSMSMIADMYPKSRRSLALGFYMSGPHIGLLLAIALGGWIAQTHGWRAIFLTFGLPGMALALLLWMLGREPARGSFDTQPSEAARPASESLWRRIKAIFAIPAFRYLCLGCGFAGIAGYGYGIWAPTFLVRTHNLSLAAAGLIFGFGSGLGACAGALFGGWYADRLSARDQRWQVGLPLLGTLLSLPMGIAFLLWPTDGATMVGSLRVPHAVWFAFGFSFFNSWWPPMSYAAISHMLTARQRALGAAILNFFLTVAGAGLGPLASGMLSDLFAARMGSDGLRYALTVVLLLMVATLFFFYRAIGPYRARLQAMVAATP